MAFRKYDQPDKAKPVGPGKQHRLNGEALAPQPATKCKVCSQLTPAEKDALKDDWLTADMEPEQLADKYKVGHRAMERHVRRCLFNKHRSRYDRLRTLMDDVFVDIDLARQEFRAKPSFNNSCSYQGLLREFRATLNDLEAIQDASEMSDELIELVFNPLIRRMTQVIASEAGGLKEDLTSRLGEGDAQAIVHDLVDRVKEQFSDEVNKTRERLDSHLGAKDKNRKRALDKPKAKPGLKAI